MSGCGWVSVSEGGREKRGSEGRRKEQAGEQLFRAFMY